MALKPPGCAAEGGAQCRWGLGLTPRRRARNRNSSVRTWPPTRRRRPCSATVHGTPAARRLRPPALVPRSSAWVSAGSYSRGQERRAPTQPTTEGLCPPLPRVRTAVEGGQRRSACGPGTLTPARPGDDPGSRCRCWRVPAGGREEQRDTAPRPRTCAGGGTRGPERRGTPPSAPMPPPTGSEEDSVLQTLGPKHGKCQLQNTLPA